VYTLLVVYVNVQVGFGHDMLVSDQTVSGANMILLTVAPSMHTSVLDFTNRSLQNLKQISLASSGSSPLGLSPSHQARVRDPLVWSTEVEYCCHVAWVRLGLF
jgi:hypothetical protein